MPEDLLIQIFLRFSVQSLLCAKCVCKQWYDLIENPNFVLDHLQYIKSHNKGRVLLQYFKEDIQRHSYALFDNETLESNIYHDIDHVQLQWYPIHMEGPINGLYCLFSGRDRIVLWNPALMELQSLPVPHPHFFPHIRVYEGYTGFGVDSSTHDYKLVLFRRFKKEFDLYPRRYVSVYNLHTDSWKRLKLGDFNLMEHGFYENQNSSFLDGSCHWWTTGGVVIAFDMLEERFRKILGPDLSKDSESSTGSLTIYDDKVALMLRYEYFVDVWVMLEDCLWNKQFSVTSFPRFSWDIGLWKNGGLFVAMDGFETQDLNPNFQMVLYNSNNRETRVVGPKGMPMCFRVSVYYESLVSLGKGRKHKGKKESLNMVSDFLMPYSNPYAKL